MADHNISIDVKLMSEKVISELKGIRDYLNGIKANSNITINIKAPNLSNISKELSAIKQDFGNFAEGLGVGLGEGFQAILDKLDEIHGKKVEPEVDTSGLEDAGEKADEMADKFEKAASVLQMMSGVFSTLSIASSALGDFGGMFADSVSAMSNMVSLDALGTAKRYLTAMATKAVTGQISGIIERYDIMNTFSDYMELAGVSESVANESLSRVDQSIRGIPIGLDEAAFRLRKYQMYMGDIDRATNFTIGIQKAITAGGASEQMKTTAYTQIDRLLATGKLGQSRQWLSLFNGLGVSLKFLKEELALDPTADLKTVAADLASGAISTDAFIRAIERLADNEGLDRALEIYKGTIEAWQSNINNAIKRGGQNIMENVNSVMEDTLGYGITGVMKNIRDGIDTASKEAGQYIKDNPQHVRTIRGAVEVLLDRVMTLDGGRFVENVIKNIGGIANVISQIIGQFPKGFLEDFVSFAMTWAGPLSAVMKAAQSGFGVVLGVFDRLNKMDISKLISKITREIERMAKIVSKLLGMIPDGLLGDLMAFGLVWGKPLAKVFSGIATALSAVSASLMNMSMGGNGGLLGTLLGWIIGNPGAAAILAGVAAGIGAIAIATSHFNDALNERIEERHINAREVLKIDELEGSLEQYDTLNETIKQHAQSYQEDISSIQGNAEAAKILVDEVFGLYAKLDELEGPEQERERSKVLQQLAQDLEELKALEPGIDLSQLLTGSIDMSAAQDLQELTEAYIDMVAAEAEMLEVQDALEEAYADKGAARRAKRSAEKDMLHYRDELVQRERTLDAIEKQYGIGKYSDDSTNIGYGLDEAGIRLTAAEQAEWDDAIARRNEAQLAYNTAEEGFNKTIEAEKEADEYLQTVRDDMTDVINQQREYANTDMSAVMSDEAKAAKEEAEEISALAQAYGELEEAAVESIKSQIDLFKELNTEQEKSLDTLNQNINANTGRAAQQRDYSSSIRRGLENIDLTNDQKAYLAWYAAELLGENETTGLGELAGALGMVDQNGNLTPEGRAALEPIMASAIRGSRVEGVSQTTAENLAWFEATYEAGGDTEIATQSQEEFQLSIDGVTESEKDSIKPTQELSKEQKNLGKTGQEAAKGTQSVAEGIKQAGSAASSQSGNISAISSSFHSVRSAALTATIAVAALAAAINSLHDKSITIAVNMKNGGAIKAAATNIWGSVFHPAWGGMLDYLAGGGHPGIAKGTDIVPAWLTPGEFVMRRSAVGLFGSNFMKRVNAMDIGGAFDALMQRVSNPMNHGYGNTYNRDNHATVNNYFYGDGGQGYSQRKAYRYAGSL